MLDRNTFPRTPTGADNEARRFIDTQQKLHPPRRPVSQQVSIPNVPGSLWPWMYPTHVEGDPTLSYTAGKAMYLSPNNPLVTTGLRDAANPTGSLVLAQPGFYIALKNVPPQAVVSGNTVYNVPVVAPQGAVAGTPLKGDLDSPTLFWAKIPQTNSCF